MKLGIIPYQLETDFVSNSDAELKYKRPNFPSFHETHSVNSDLQFVKPEDIPLNKRNFLYRVGAANPLFKELGYSVTEYPFETPGFNLMDRAGSVSILKDANNMISVQESLGWRSARSDVCVKEGVTYWEIEIIKGGNILVDSNGEIIDGAQSRQRKKDLLDTTPHIRMGITRRETSLEAPVGFDAYGYGIRDNNLESIHEGKVMQVLDNLGELCLKPGDRIGFLLRLPSMEEQISQAKEYSRRRVDALSQHHEGIGMKKEHSNEVTESWKPDIDGPVKKKSRHHNLSNIEFQKALLNGIDYSNVIRDHIALRYKNQLFFEATDYIKTTKPEYYSSDKRERQDYYQLSNSSLGIYLNDKFLGNAFENIKPFLPPFSEVQYNEKFYFNYWKNGVHSEEGNMDDQQHKNANSKKRTTGHLLRNKYSNNNKLGYYPTVSCFNGGTARIHVKKDELKYFTAVVKKSDEEIKTLDILYMEQIADDIVWDIIDEIEEEYTSCLLYTSRCV